MQMVMNLKRKIIKTGKKFFFLYVKLSLLILIPLTLIILPADYFDTGNSLCIHYLITGKQCYGCGTTRAIQHLIHGEFTKAWQFNKLSFIIFALLLYLWIKYVVKIIRKIWISHKNFSQKP